MAKKQTRRSISVSRTTYERLKAFCEANNISMSQLVETRVNDFLGGEPVSTPAPRPVVMPIASSPAVPRPLPMPAPAASAPRVAPPVVTTPAAQTAPAPAPLTSAAARIAVEPPPPVIKPRQQESAPKPAEKRADQIFTF